MMMTPKKRKGRPKGSKNKPKTPIVEEKQVIIEKEEEPERIDNSSSGKWNSYTVDQRKAVLKEMMSKGIIKTSIKKTIDDYFKGLEETDTRFSCLSYDLQGSVISFIKNFRKNS
jgi:hypothetical protein